MSKYFTTLTRTATLLLAALLIASSAVVLLQPLYTAQAQQASEEKKDKKDKKKDKKEDKEKKKLNSSKDEKDCKSKGGYVHPSYAGGDWKGKYCLTEGEYATLQQKGEFDENSETICRVLGIENCDETVTKAYDECAAEVGSKKDKKTTERDEVVDCVSKKVGIDKEKFENGLKGKKTINKNEKAVCVVSGMGWVICPIMLFLASMADGIQGSFEHFLTYETLTHTDSSKSVRDVWGTFRNMANFGFVIAFLFIVFSQLTSYGITNYGIKRALPRLIVLSLIVNLSFPIAVVAIDASNIIGASAKHFIENLIVKDGTQLGSYREVTALLLAGVFTTVITGAISIGVGGLIVKGMFYGLLGILLPVLIIAVTALGTMFIVLIARHALITILVAVMPVALMMQLLPNTKVVYLKWKKLSLTLLMLYPVISVVFGLAKFTSSVIYSASPDDTLVQILALGVQAIPFFVVPYLIKAAGATSGLGRVVSKGAQSLNKRMSGSAGRFVQRKRKEADIQIQGKINQKFGIKKGDSRLRRIGKRSMAAIVGGSAYRARQAAMKDSFVDLQLSRAARSVHLRDAAQNPKAFGFKPGDNLHATILGQAARVEAQEEEEDIKAQAILIQDYSNAELDALTTKPNLSVAQKVALLQEITSRNEARALSYMQILLNQNATGTYSSTVANSVANTLRQHAPGLVSEQTLQKIITRPIPRIQYGAPQLAGAGVGAGSSGGAGEADASGVALPKANNIADKVAEREKALQEGSEDATTQETTTDKPTKEEPDTSKDAATATDDPTAVPEGGIDLAAEIDSNIASGGLSVENAYNLSPEIIGYIRDNGSEDAKAHLRDALMVAVNDKEVKGKVRNFEEMRQFTEEGGMLTDGLYAAVLAKHRKEAEDQMRKVRAQQRQAKKQQATEKPPRPRDKITKARLNRLRQQGRAGRR